ncbi:anti-sigma factor [Agromyces salentinus]|uniref:Regulator of SigK n=1 Tax=Agromyces salentinus TaxID=269421 RepID=A0ABN2MJF9_9MICO|nr:anti-sigma factor [Agromyces salentinus]
MNPSDGPAGDELRELIDLAPAYALDALDEFERARFERALPGSPELQAEVDSFRAIAAGLGDDVAPLAPPPSLKAGLFDRLDSAPQEQRAAGPAAPQGRADVAEPAPFAPAEPVRAEPAPVADLGERRSRRRLAIALSSAAAAVLLITSVVVGANWFGPNGWGAEREMSTIAAAPDAQQTTAEVAGGGEVTLVSSAELGRSAVLVDGLEQLGDEETYELWYIDESGPVSAGTFDVPGDGETWRVLEGDFAPGVVVGITVEPAGGSEQPTTEPVAVIQT